MDQIKTILNNGVEMPLLGLGVYDMHGKESEQAILDALEIGYRLIDTASMYHNETEVGNAIRQSGLPRKEIFITTKVNNSDQGFDDALKAFDVSLAKLKTDYIDLYLVHWPIKGKRKDTWKALEKIYASGRAKAIGVANYLVPFLDELKTYANITPAVNQVEFSPYLFLKDLLNYCKKDKIQLQAYSPLLRGKKFKDPALLQLAKKYNKTPAQIILRWDIELGVSPIPKSVNPERLKENFNVFDFSLSKEDVELMNGFDENLRVVDDPMDHF
ncbi:MAG: aldo/keto reductase [Bacteroidetes bacterium]|nr:aldo/keto reductase [Bacteroidota bacterium]